MDDFAFSYHRRSTFDWLFDSYQSKGTWVAAALVIVYLVYNSFLRFDLFPLLSIPELVWNAVVFATPTRLAIALDRWKSPDFYATERPEAQTRSEMHALKSEALRRVFGLETGLIANIPGASSIRRASWLGGINSSQSDAPPGLGNWDNSCYQNSVLQGLSALRSLTTYLEKSELISQQDSSTTAGSLRETMSKLNDETNNGRRIWTPAKLKSMSSWQQQDAQEYFSKIMDDMEKDTTKAQAGKIPTEGLKEVKKWETSPPQDQHQVVGKDPVAADDSPAKPAPSEKTPLDGHLAQRVACLKCGFSEGLSMIPFNCLTVPLGNDYTYNLAQCLDAYTNLDEITGVECAKCTLLQQKTQLENQINPISLQDTTPAESTNPDIPASAISLPPALRQLFVERLAAVQQALDDADFSDATLNKKCSIPKKARVSSTKTRQAVIARAPTGLVVHINRSLFDENTGDLRKNTAQVQYPRVLDLGPWCLGVKSGQDTEKEEWRMNPAKSMIAGSGWNKSSQRLQYILRAAVCHYGRHENGHYICYREHPEAQKEGEEDMKKMKWWRLSDDDVSAVTEAQVLGQGGVFMLFYERLETPPASETSLIVEGVKEKMPASIDMEDEKKEAPVTDGVEKRSVVEGVEPTAISQASISDTVNAPDTTVGIVPESEVSLELERSRPSTESVVQLPLQPQPEQEVSSQQSTHDARNIAPPPTMRTARRGSKKSRGGFEPAFRAVAAT